MVSALGHPFQPDSLTSLSRYDIHLAFVPVAFLVALLVGEAVDATVQLRLVSAALVSLAALVDCLFLHPPSEGAAE